MKCPYCGKGLRLVAAEVENQPKRSLDEDLADDAEFLHVTLGEGVVIYTMKEYIPGDEGVMIWRRIDAIIQRYGGKWIKDGKESHWEVPTT